jgi:hypothetical protein
MSRALPLAGFQVTLIGRFWVIPEVDLLKTKEMTQLLKLDHAKCCIYLQVVVPPVCSPGDS